jgi:serine/threonine-protein phosphatase 2A regulatory subunit B'
MDDLMCIIDVLPSQRQELFCRKLAQCTVLFDFEDPNSNLKSKDIKRQALQELTEYVATKRGVITDYIYPKAIKMVRTGHVGDFLI